jgi:hypothetical protein
MFNYKKLFKLQIRPPSLFLLITCPRIGECFPAETEKFDDNNNNNKANPGTSDISTMNSYIRIVAAQCFIGIWFVSGI